MLIVLHIGLLLLIPLERKQAYPWFGRLELIPAVIFFAAGLVLDAGAGQVIWAVVLVGVLLLFFSRDGGWLRLEEQAL